MPRVDCDKCASVEMRLGGVQGVHDDVADCGGQHILCSDLNDAGSAASPKREQPPEI